MLKNQVNTEPEVFSGNIMEGETTGDLLLLRKVETHILATDCKSVVEGSTSLERDLASFGNERRL